MDPSNATALGVLNVEESGHDSVASGNQALVETDNPQGNGGIAVLTASSDGPPDGGYGWICVGCVFLINAHTWGINSVKFRHIGHRLHGC